MSKLYDFRRLINKYSCSFTLITKGEGKYEGGIYVDGEPIEQEMTGAVVPMSSKKIYGSGGTYTAQDKQLYMYSEIPKALLGSQVKYNDCVYNIEEDSDYSEFADVWEYVLKRVSAE